MAKETTTGRGKPAQSHADAINRQLAKIRELERGVEALKEKEALRLFKLVEKTGWFDVSVPDDAFVDAVTELVERHRGGAGRGESRDAAEPAALV